LPRRDWRLRIEDILDAIERVQRHTAGQGLAAFLADEKTIDAVARCFGIVGEAARHVPDDVAAAHPELPWAEMRAMRSVLVHAYFDVTNETLWKTAHEDLPGLVGLLRQLLASS
jgi:uncharacterized protein with HEPN domain